MTVVTSTLVLGGASSGKSAHAEEIVRNLPGEPIYVATAQAFDDEMIDPWDAEEEPERLAVLRAAEDTARAK